MWLYCDASLKPMPNSAFIQYIPRNMHTVFALLCFVVVIHWLIFPYPSGLLHWHCGNLTIAPVPAKQPCWIWINTSCEFIMNDCITTTKQSTTKPCAYFLGYTVVWFPMYFLGLITWWHTPQLIPSLNPSLGQLFLGTNLSFPALKITMRTWCPISFTREYSKTLKL